MLSVPSFAGTPHTLIESGETLHSNSPMRLSIPPVEFFEIFGQFAIVAVGRANVRQLVNRSLGLRSFVLGKIKRSGSGHGLPLFYIAPTCPHEMRHVRDVTSFCHHYCVFVARPGCRTIAIGFITFAWLMAGVAIETAKNNENAEATEVLRQP